MGYKICIDQVFDSSPALIHRHAGVLGLASCVQAFPYDVPSWMPQILLDLGDHLHDPHPIQVREMEEQWQCLGFLCPPYNWDSALQLGLKMQRVLFDF